MEYYIILTELFFIVVILVVIIIFLLGLSEKRKEITKMMSPILREDKTIVPISISALIPNSEFMTTRTPELMIKFATKNAIIEKMLPEINKYITTQSWNNPKSDSVEFKLTLLVIKP